MRRRTGTSKTGKVHRYYTYFGATRQARAEEASTVDERIGRLEHEAREVEERLSRLYRAIEDGVAELDDMLKDRIASLKADREKTRRQRWSGHDQRRGRSSRSAVRSSNASPDFLHCRDQTSIAVTMREKMCSGEVPFRKAYLGAILDRIEVDDGKVRIIGRKDVLEQAVAREGVITPGVRSFVRNWRRGWDSNPRDSFPPTRVPGVRLQPLGHLSVVRGTIAPRSAVARCVT